MMRMISIGSMMMFLSKSTDTFVDQQADEADGHGGKENPDGGLPIPAAQGIAAQYRGDHRRQAADAGDPEEVAKAYGGEPGAVAQHVLGGAGEQKRDGDEG